MIIYSIPLIFLSVLTLLEDRNNKASVTSNKYLYFLTFLFLTFFIGFRNEIGCDWDGYLENFASVNSKSWDTLFSQYYKGSYNQVYDIGYTIIVKILSYKFNFHLTILILSFFFYNSFIYFLRSIKKTLFSANYFLSIFYCSDWNGSHKTGNINCIFNGLHNMYF